MADTIRITLVPDPQDLATLRGKDYDDAITAGSTGPEIDWQVSPSIGVHGSGTFNDKKEHASLLVFTVEASGTTKRPVKGLKLSLVFEDGDSSNTKPDARLAPRVVTWGYWPGRAGYKVECTSGTKKTTKSTKITPKAEVDAGPAKLGLDVERGKDVEIEKEMEFYTFVKGVPRRSDEYHPHNNSVHWTFEGEMDKNGKKNGGVPPVVEVVALVIRAQDGPFRCYATMSVEIDWVYSVKENLSKFMWWKDKTPPAPKVYDVTKQEQPDKKITLTTLEIYNDKSGKKMQEFAEIKMAERYVKHKVDSQDDSDD
jgi:hypothetical protein